ncbi:piggyBac transposable element-derived protein 4 [Trichonephila clavipes]|nr:piggyBac transposable element-derived protein 4 [Trichonephila clavipes]
MEGFNCFDQRKIPNKKICKMVASYFLFLIDLAIINSFLLWKVSKRRSLDQLTFHIALARQLKDGYSTRKRKGLPVCFQAKKCVLTEDVHLASVGKSFAKGCFHLETMQMISEVDSDDVQELLDSPNQELKIDELTKMHE